MIKTNWKRFEIILDIDQNRITQCPSCQRIRRNIWDDDKEDQAELEAAELVPTRKRSTMFVKFNSCYIKSRQFGKKIVENEVTTWIIMGAIIINALSMGAEHHQQPQELTDAIEIMNYIFTCLFVLEMLAKVYVYGFLGYFRDGFNMLDFIIVIISVMELFQGGASSLSVLRTFRLVRIVKLIRFLPALQKQLYVMLKTIDNVATFFLLLSLFLFIFSVLGMSLFGCKFCPANQAKINLERRIEWIQETNDTTQDLHRLQRTLEKQTAIAYHSCPRANFDSLLWSVMTVFQVLTQESWASVLKDGMHYTSEWAALYFVALVTFGNYVLFNLLIAILVEGFSTDDVSLNNSQQS